jgi:hypothetical protein
VTQVEKHAAYGGAWKHSNANGAAPIAGGRPALPVGYKGTSVYLSLLLSLLLLLLLLSVCLAQPFALKN